MGEGRFLCESRVEGALKTLLRVLMYDRKMSYIRSNVGRNASISSTFPDFCAEGMCLAFLFIA